MGSPLDAANSFSSVECRKPKRFGNHCVNNVIIEAERKQKSFLFYSTAFLTCLILTY